jgi:arylsulfatase A-like enzyme
VRFDTAYAASSFTLPSLHTILTGESPPVHRVRFWTHFGNLYRAPTLAERLREEGFDTACFTSGYGDLSAYPLLSRGFGSSLHLVQKPAEDVLAPFAQWLGDPARRERTFAWIHLVEPHTPYGPEERFCEGLLDVARYRAAGPAPWPVDRWLPQVPGPRPELLADRLYAADVRAADDAVGRILDGIERRGLAERTLVCVVADHGENLSADPPPRWDHGTSCDEQQVRVPLLLAGPGIAAGRREAAIARHVDLAPTFLAALGVDGAEELPGRDLLGAAPPPPFALTEGTTYVNVDAPFYSVTDARTSLRIFTDAAPARAFLRREPAGVEGRVEVDLSAPPPGAAAHVAAWKSFAEECLRRAEERNDAGDDRARLTDAQRRVLERGGYLGGR